MSFEVQVLQIPTYAWLGGVGLDVDRCIMWAIEYEANACFLHNHKSVKTFDRKLVLTFDFIQQYRILRKFGGGRAWRIDSYQAFAERKFGELIDQPIRY